MQKLINAACAIAEKDAVLLALRGLLRFFTGIQKEQRRSVIALIKTRLIKLMGKNKKYIAQNVIFLYTQLAYSIRFYCMGSVGMTQEWVLNDNITSAETVVQMMFHSMPENLYRILF